MGQCTYTVKILALDRLFARRAHLSRSPAPPQVVAGLPWLIDTLAVFGAEAEDIEPIIEKDNDKSWSFTPPPTSSR